MEPAERASDPASRGSESALRASGSLGVPHIQLGGLQSQLRKPKIKREGFKSQLRMTQIQLEVEIAGKTWGRPSESAVGLGAEKGRLDRRTDRRTDGRMNGLTSKQK